MQSTWRGSCSRRHVNGLCLLAVYEPLSWLPCSARISYAWRGRRLEGRRGDGRDGGSRRRAALRCTVLGGTGWNWAVAQRVGCSTQALLKHAMRARLQVGVVSPRQPFPFWVHTHLIALRMVGMEPAGAPCARLVGGTEIRIAPRVRMRSGPGAANGRVFGAAKPEAPGGAGARAAGSAGAAQQRPGNGADNGSGPAAAPEPGVETALRVQRVAARLAAQCAAGLKGPVPASVVPVGVAPATLARCGLREGDWVRLEGPGAAAAAAAPAAAPARAAGRFACLVACPEAAVGHLALSSSQCAGFGVAPCSHVRVQRLTAAQRALVLEAAELQQGTAGRAEGAAAPATAAPAAAGEAEGEAAQLASAGKRSPSGAAAEEEEEQGDAAPMEDVGWLGEALEKAVQALLPVLAATPRYLLQVRGGRAGGRQAGDMSNGPAA